MKKIFKWWFWLPLSFLKPYDVAEWIFEADTPIHRQTRFYIILAINGGWLLIIGGVIVKIIK